MHACVGQHWDWYLVPGQQDSTKLGKLKSHRWQAPHLGSEAGLEFNRSTSAEQLQVCGDASVCCGRTGFPPELSLKCPDIAPENHPFAAPMQGGTVASLYN